MEFRKLGTTDIKVPSVCLGTMTWGRQHTEAEAHKQLEYAVKERGLTFIDTAEIYPFPSGDEKQGTTESILGNWLQHYEKREELIIASKIAPSDSLHTRGERGVRAPLDKKNITEAVDGSLERLKTDYIDLYQVHWPERKGTFFKARSYVEAPEDDPTPIEETLEALGELVKAGKVRHVGISNETPWGMHEYLRAAEEKGLPRIVSIQNQYSLTNRSFEIGLAEFSVREQVGLLAWSPLNMGYLTGKYIGGELPEGSRFAHRGAHSDRFARPHATEATKRYVKIAEDHGLDPAQMALAFVISRPFTTSAIIGASSVDQLKTNIDAAELTLSDAVIEEIDAVLHDIPDPTA